jgi:hypothetical protein
MTIQSIEEVKFSGGSQSIGEWLEGIQSRLQQYGNGFAIPKDSGEKTALARCLVSLFSKLADSEVGIYVTEWGVWPSSENHEIFDAYRLAKGAVRPLEDAPIHIFSCPADPSFLGILCLILYFFWDAEVFDINGRCNVSLSHDEWLEIRTDDREIRQVCDLAVETHRLKPLAYSK